MSALDEKYFELSIHEGLFHLPKDKNEKQHQARTVSASGWQPVNMTALDFTEHVFCGRAFAPIYQDGKRGTGTTERVQYIALDFDDNVSVLEATRHPFIEQFCHIVGPTASDRPQHRRTRVILLLDEPIRDQITYQQLAKRVLYQVRDLRPDQAATKDFARFWFGGKDADLIQYNKRLLTCTDLEALPDAPKPTNTSAAIPARPTNLAVSTDYQHNREQTYLNSALQGEVAELHATGEGNRNNQLNKSAYALGQLVNAGLDENLIRNELHNAAQAVGLPHDEIERTLNSGLTAGMANPRSIPAQTVRTYTPPDNKLDLAAAPTTNANDSTSKVTIEPVIKSVTLNETIGSLGPETIYRFLTQNEYGDALLFQELYRQRLVFDRTTSQWFAWQGHHWAELHEGILLVFQQLGDQYESAANAFGQKATRAARDGENELQKEYERKRSECLQRLNQLRSNRRAKNILEIAAKLFGIAGDEWDANPMLLGAANGIIDLKTGELRAGHPLDYVRTIAPVTYDPMADAKRWQQFLCEIFDGDSELVAFMQRLLGYAITGLHSEHKLPILYGKGRNGKDTLLETVGYVLGKNAAPGSEDLLIDSGRQRAAGSASPHIYDLMGKRLIWVSETRDKAQMNTNQVKRLTGGNTLKARPLHGQFVEFGATHQLLLLTNHKPDVGSEAEDYAIWQRLLLIPFNLSFVDNPTRSNERQADPHLGDKLKADAAGILNWLIQGCLLWQSAGLEPPQSILAATDEYKQSQDLVGQFLDECTYTHENAQIPAGKLYQAYQQWCSDNGITRVHSNRTFGERMRESFERVRTSRGNAYQRVGLIVEKAAYYAQD
jgi:putative DNA primase/helicase